MSISSIDFDAGTITLSNYGDAEVDPNGLILCNFPIYVPIDGVPTIAPGGSIRVDAIALGQELDVGTGEMGIYTSQDFEDPGSIIAYVEWGEGGHERSSVAQEAGIWTDGFVDPAGETAITAAELVPTAPDMWVPGPPAVTQAPAAAEEEAVEDAVEEAVEELAETGVASDVGMFLAIGFLVLGVSALAFRRQLFVRR